MVVPSYPVPPYFTFSESPKRAKARHSAQGIADSLAKRCNAAWARLGAPFGRGEKRPAALLRELERGLAIPALARLASDRFSPR